MVLVAAEYLKKAGADPPFSWQDMRFANFHKIFLHTSVFYHSYFLLYLCDSCTEFRV